MKKIGVVATKCADGFSHTILPSEYHADSLFCDKSRLGSIKIGSLMVGLIEDLMKTSNLQTQPTITNTCPAIYSVVIPSTYYQATMRQLKAES
jgi:hypothetical protein